MGVVRKSAWLQDLSSIAARDLVHYASEGSMSILWGQSPRIFGEPSRKGPHPQSRRRQDVQQRSAEAPALSTEARELSTEQTDPKADPSLHRPESQTRQGHFRLQLVASDPSRHQKQSPPPSAPGWRRPKFFENRPNFPDAASTQPHSPEMLSSVRRAAWVARAALRPTP